MRWRTERPPVAGDRRIVHEFALLPVRLNDGYTIWLEKYKEVQEYRE